jgi:hypothetical protein
VHAEHGALTLLYLGNPTVERTKHKIIRMYFSSFDGF